MALDISKRVYSSEVQQKKEGAEVIVGGWAAEVKSLGKIAFIKLRDRAGVLQLVSTNSKLVDKIAKVTHESVLIAKGKIQASKAKAGGKELQLEDFEVLSEADPRLPIDMSGKIATDLSKRLDWRVLDLRHQKNAAVFKIRSVINHAIRNFLIAHNFTEIQTPKLVGAGAEGGATLFPVVYYDKKAYLSQSQQLYKQMMLSAGLDRVFEIGPNFRAEESHTTRHLAEFTQLDFEMAWIKDEEDVLQTLEKLFVFVIGELEKYARPELNLLKVELEAPKLPFPRITYEEALKLLGKEGSKLKFGDDIGTDEEKKLGGIVKEKYKTDAYFITKYPWSQKPFYIMKDGTKLSRGFDFEYKGEEMSSGGQREHRIEVLEKQMKEKNLKAKDFDFYLAAFKYGMPAHGGFGMGIDRLVKNILGLDNIREAVLFPRDPQRLTP